MSFAIATIEALCNQCISINGIKVMTNMQFVREFKCTTCLAASPIDDPPFDGYRKNERENASGQLGAFCFCTPFISETRFHF